MDLNTKVMLWAIIGSTVISVIWALILKEPTRLGGLVPYLVKKLKGGEEEWI